jgi:hypothetical protein
MKDPGRPHNHSALTLSREDYSLSSLIALARLRSQYAGEDNE